MDLGAMTASTVLGLYLDGQQEGNELIMLSELQVTCAAAAAAAASSASVGLHAHSAASVYAASAASAYTEMLVA
jgi:hypothetical protein